MRLRHCLPPLAASLILSACVTDGAAPVSARPVQLAALDVGDGALPARILSGGANEPGAPPPAQILTDDETTDGLSRTEARIADLINAYRAEHGLPPAPLSPALTAVAHAHAEDLARNRPDRGGCSMHSWSEEGDWTPVCYTPDHAQAAAMWSKPGELTDYSGRGFEIAWRGGFGPVAPQAALQGWEHSARHNAVLLETGPWAETDWKAMGVGVAGSYAVVWFGRRADPAG